MTIEHIWIDLVLLLAACFLGWWAYTIEFYDPRTGNNAEGLTATVRILMAIWSLAMVLLIAVVEGLVVIK